MVHEIAQVIGVNTDTEETICQLIWKPNQYIRAKGVRNAINDLHFKDKYGSKGYFVYLHYNEDEKAWFITEQVQHLKHYMLLCCRIHQQLKNRLQTIRVYLEYLLLVLLFDKVKLCLMHKMHVLYYLDFYLKPYHLEHMFKLI